MILQPRLSLLLANNGLLNLSCKMRDEGEIIKETPATQERITEDAWFTEQVGNSLFVGIKKKGILRLRGQLFIPHRKQLP